MKIYFNAFVGTCLLMLMAGIIAEAFAYGFLTALKASKAVLLTGEGITLIGILIASVFVFRMTLDTERELAAQSLSIAE